MKWSKLVLEGAYRFDEKKLSAAERATWRSLPSELRAVLRKTNGAFVEGHPTFATKIARTMPDGKIERGQTNWLTELWAFIPRRQRPRAKGPRSIMHEHVGRHVAEEFLPDGVFVFGACEQGCLVAVSTNAHDHGAIYYWEWYWQYPWYKPFFEKRLDRLRKRWPNRYDIGPDHPDYTRYALGVGRARVDAGAERAACPAVAHRGERAQISQSANQSPKSQIHAFYVI